MNLHWGIPHGGKGLKRRRPAPLPHERNLHPVLQLGERPGRAGRGRQRADRRQRRRDRRQRLLARRLHLQRPAVRAARREPGAALLLPQQPAGPRLRRTALQRRARQQRQRRRHPQAAVPAQHRRALVPAPVRLLGVLQLVHHRRCDAELHLLLRRRARRLRDPQPHLRRQPDLLEPAQRQAPADLHRDHQPDQDPAPLFLQLPRQPGHRDGVHQPDRSRHGRPDRQLLRPGHGRLHELLLGRRHDPRHVRQPDAAGHRGRVRRRRQPAVARDRERPARAGQQRLAGVHRGLAERQLPPQRQAHALARRALRELHQPARRPQRQPDRRQRAQPRLLGQGLQQRVLLQAGRVRRGQRLGRDAGGRRVRHAGQLRGGRPRLRAGQLRQRRSARARSRTATSSRGWPSRTRSTPTPCCAARTASTRARSTPRGCSTTTSTTATTRKYAASNFIGYGFNSPDHELRPDISYNTDFSLEQHLRGSDVSYKATPFYRSTRDQLQAFPIGVGGIVSGFNVGHQTSYGLELALRKGDFARDGFAGQLSYTYTHSRIKYSQFPSGTNVIDSINNYVKDYNAYTSFCGSHPGDARCGTTVSRQPRRGVLRLDRRAGAVRCGRARSRTRTSTSRCRACSRSTASTRPTTRSRSRSSARTATRRRTCSPRWCSTSTARSTVTPSLTFSSGSTYGSPLSYPGYIPDGRLHRSGPPVHVQRLHQRQRRRAGLPVHAQRLQRRVRQPRRVQRALAADRSTCRPRTT